MNHFISGIQQIGIGVKNTQESLQKYKSLFGMDTLVFSDVSEAALMTRYTGGDVHKRHAVLSMNLQGGGGFEIWQFLSRDPAEPISKISYGDLGIFSPKIKCLDVKQAHAAISKYADVTLSPVQTDPLGGKHFWVKDCYNNWFNVVSCEHWFNKNNKYTGGVAGAVIGVSDIDKALTVYKDVLGISEVAYDVTGEFNDNPEGKSQRLRRVLLRKAPGGKGAFNKLLGSVEIELVQCLDRTPQTIYDKRYWGDCGFIHLCFDVLDMDGLKTFAQKKGFDFTIDSKDSFAMESAAGRFCYMEDPDGTLIELVETHKVPIMKKFGWYINLKKRDIQKPLPDWMIKLLGLSKVK